MDVKFGIPLAQLNPTAWTDVSVEADRLGFESVWQSDHLVIPFGSTDDEDPDTRLRNPETPLFDAIANLCWLAARTERIRLGTFVYLLALRHPFVAARGFTTLDVLSGGRAIVGVGVGSIRSEFSAAGLDPSGRGSRLDEAIEVCRALWAGGPVEHKGRHFRFPRVSLSPRPQQQPLPLHVGGESDAALRRTARYADGWLAARLHTPDSIAPYVERLRELEAAERRDRSLEVTTLARVATSADVDAFERLGVDRLVVAPWRRTSESIDGVRRFASAFV